ncbi:hypothetical protein [Saliterribacillus persicus]|uniref:Uncharacterized protein n=1 Tax=Saliterribacillus persicus TaxID=930114 RepID=A0A368X8J5_9BACI|nr:hypothetical protein [Saliterribacillus persicus]RCW63536.1 hypothetical protein DFR57_11712 [Saliterribacillus persicus]
MLMIQQGPAAGPKLKKIIDSNFCDGIIWDPRDLTSSRINQYIRENIEYEDLVKVMEFKQYYQQFDNSDKKKLKDYPEFPKELIDRAFLRRQENLEELVHNNIDFQQSVELDYLCTPTFYIESFGHRIIERVLETWQKNITYMNSHEDSNPLFATMVISENAFSNYDYINEFLEDLEDFSEELEGVYFTVDRNEMSSLRHKFDLAHLTNILQFIYDLKVMGFKVIVGYTSVEGLLYSSVGADYVGTGWFYSLRKFNRVQKGLPPEKAFGIQKKRYTSIKVFSEVPLQEAIYNVGARSHPIILDNCSLDRELILETPIDILNSNDCYLQHFEEMYKYVQIFDSLPDVSDKTNKVLNLLEEAETNIQLFNNLPNNTYTINSGHIKQYSDAIKSVKEANFI